MSRSSAPGLLIRSGFAKTCVQSRGNMFVSNARGALRLPGDAPKSNSLKSRVNNAAFTHTRRTRLGVTHRCQEGIHLPEFVDSAHLGWPPLAQKEQPAQRLDRRRLSVSPASRCTTPPIERNPRLWNLRWRRSTRNLLADGSPRWCLSMQFAPGSKKTTEADCCAKNRGRVRRRGVLLHVLWAKKISRRYFMPSKSSNICRALSVLENTNTWSPSSSRI